MTFQELEQEANENLTDILYAIPQNDKAAKEIIKFIWEE